jgi:hypothetical protein
MQCSVNFSLRILHYIFFSIILEIFCYTFVVLQTLIGFGRKGENLPKMLSTEIAPCTAAPHFVRQGRAESISVYAFCNRILL